MNYLVLVLLIIVHSVFPQLAMAQTNECAQIENTSDRLDCFDRQFPATQTDATKTQPAIVESIPNADSSSPEIFSTEPSSPELSNAEPSNTEPSSTEPSSTKSDNNMATTSMSAPDARSDQPDEMPTRRMFSWNKQEKFVSVIKEMISEDSQKMVFLLENGQVWLQTSPRNLPFKVGDKVTVKSAMIGGYFIRTDNGVSTRVNRKK